MNQYIDQISDLKAKLIVAERDLADAKAALKTERESYQRMIENPDMQVQIMGIRLGQYKEIMETIAEWRRLGKPTLAQVEAAGKS